MDSVADIINALSRNWGVLAFLLICVVMSVIGVKSGIITYKGKGLTIGDSISPYSRIRQLQWDYLNARTEIALRSLPSEYLSEPKKWRTHYVLGKYRDVLQQAIINNNIIDDESYIESKQMLSYSAILKATVDDYFRSDEFLKFINGETRAIILQFVKIKKEYGDD